MKNRILILVAIVILTTFGLGVYTRSKLSSDPLVNKDKIAMQENPQDLGEKDDFRYVEYSKNILEESSSKKRVLFFYANWCPTCRPADADFRKNASKIPENVVVIRVNYNDTETDQEEKELAKEYGVTYQHTYIQIDSQGKQVAKWNGGQLDQLLANLK